MRIHLQSFLLCLFVIGAVGCDSGVDNTPPAAPRMVLPVDGATNQANALELRWNPSPEALTYHVQVSRRADFSTTEAEEVDLSTTSVDVRGLQLGVMYYWHVRAINEMGVGEWSESWTFTPTTEAILPVAPGLMAPKNNAEALPTFVMFQWAASEGARSYHLEISQEPHFLRKDIDIHSISRNEKPIADLVNGYTYFWRIRAYNAAGFSPWSDTWTFVVETN